MTDDYHRHEALHVAWMLADIIDEHLLDHPAIRENPEWMLHADTAASELMELYQKIGEKHLG